MLGLEFSFDATIAVVPTQRKVTKWSTNGKQNPSWIFLFKDDLFKSEVRKTLISMLFRKILTTGITKVGTDLMIKVYCGKTRNYTHNDVNQHVRKAVALTFKRVGSSVAIQSAPYWHPSNMKKLSNPTLGSLLGSRDIFMLVERFWLMWSTVVTRGSVFCHVTVVNFVDLYVKIYRLLLYGSVPNIEETLTVNGRFEFNRHVSPDGKNMSRENFSSALITIVDAWVETDSESEALEFLRELYCAISPPGSFESLSRRKAFVKFSSKDSNEEAYRTESDSYNFLQQQHHESQHESPLHDVDEDDHSPVNSLFKSKSCEESKTDINLTCSTTADGSCSLRPESASPPTVGLDGKSNSTPKSEVNSLSSGRNDICDTNVSKLDDVSTLCGDDVDESNTVDLSENDSTTTINDNSETSEPTCPIRIPSLKLSSIDDGDSRRDQMSASIVSDRQKASSPSPSDCLSYSEQHLPLTQSAVSKCSDLSFQMSTNEKLQSHSLSTHSVDQTSFDNQPTAASHRDNKLRENISTSALDLSNITCETSLNSLPDNDKDQMTKDNSSTTSTPDHLLDLTDDTLPFDVMPSSKELLVDTSFCGHRVRFETSISPINTSNKDLQRPISRPDYQSETEISETACEIPNLLKGEYTTDNNCISLSEINKAQDFELPITDIKPEFVNKIIINSKKSLEKYSAMDNSPIDKTRSFEINKQLQKAAETLAVTDAYHASGSRGHQKSKIPIKMSDAKYKLEEVLLERLSNSITDGNRFQNNAIIDYVTDHTMDVGLGVIRRTNSQLFHRFRAALHTASSEPDSFVAVVPTPPPSSSLYSKRSRSGLIRKAFSASEPPPLHDELRIGNHPACRDKIKIKIPQRRVKVVRKRDFLNLSRDENRK